MPNYRLSFQLVSARHFPPIGKQLEKIADLGYDAIEPYCGTFQLAEPNALRTMCDANGLTIPSCHLPLAEFDKDRAKVIDAAKMMGAETVIAGEFPHELREQTTAGWQATGDRLGEHAEALGNAGLKLAWHNHAFEFVALPDGSRPIDHLLASPSMMWEPDLGWIHWAGYDITTELTKFPGKIAAFHFRDVAPEGVTTEDGWADIGAGTIDWRELWPVIENSGTDLLIFERESPSDWEKFARTSYGFVSNVIGRK